MAFMLKIRWDIKDGEEAGFKANQEKLCAVMTEHPGVIAYHVEYPAPGVSEWPPAALASRMKSPRASWPALAALTRQRRQARLHSTLTPTRTRWSKPYRA